MRKKLIIYLTITAMLSSLLLPMTSLAVVNVDTGDAGGDTGKGSNEWAFSLKGRGIRIGIYFVEGDEANFANGLLPEGSDESDDSEKPYVIPIGYVTDFSKEVIENIQKKYGTKYDYTVQLYTGMSVFDYMNGEGRAYTKTDASIEPYKYVKPGDSDIIDSMPEPFKCSKDDWVEWFTGDDYKNIPEISRLCGEQISAEDFMKGIYKYKGLEKHGTYKIFFEPLISARVNDVGMFLSLRDAIRYNEFHTANTPGYNNGKIVNWLNLMFEYLANKAFLYKDELPALNMVKNDGYRVEYLSSNEQEKKASRQEIINQMGPNGKIYLSMGVGVVTPERTEPIEVVIPADPIEVPEQGPEELSMEPTGKLRAEDRGNEKFNVLQGIPATEELYADIEADEYLHELNCIPVDGERTESFVVRKTYYKTWKDPDYSEDCPSCADGTVPDPDKPDSTKDCPYCTNGRISHTGSWHNNVPETVEINYTYTRKYLYWLIDRFALCSLDGARVNNDVLEGGGVDIEVNAAKYAAPEIVEFEHSDRHEDHIIADPFEELPVIDGKRVLVLDSENYSGSDVDEYSLDLTDEVDKKLGHFHVRNDSLIIDFKRPGTPAVSNIVTIVQAESPYRNEGRAPVPGKIPKSPRTNPDALYKRDLAVLKETPNGTYETTATVTYGRLGDCLNPVLEEKETLDVDNMNPVTVHTPVVCNSGVWDYDSQQIGAKETKRMDIILGEKAELKFEAKDVEHRDITGYGTRDYTKYVESKYVRFPFDVYIESAPDNYVFLEANTWHIVSKSQERLFIKVPVWVNEGNYTVSFKTIAINAPDDVDDPGDAGFNIDDPDEDAAGRREYMVNKNISNYVAYRDSKVRVVGQVRNFKITDINDYPLWEKVFRTRTGSSSHTGKSFAVGNALGGNPEPYILPIMEGSHPTQGDRGALKTGYAFKFTLETVGEYFEDNDYIRIKPTFYYVNKDGSNRRPVDIYYNEYFNGKDNILVKIGSAKDKTNRQVIVNTDIYRNMPRLTYKGHVN
jgi:hypothetical protein